VTFRNPQTLCLKISICTQAIETVDGNSQHKVGLFRTKLALPIQTEAYPLHHLAVRQASSPVLPGAQLQTRDFRSFGTMS
jgi:hypothetical protein